MTGRTADGSGAGRNDPAAGRWQSVPAAAGARLKDEGLSGA